MKIGLRFVGALFLLSGCTPPVNLYLGPTRASTEVASIFLSSTDVTIESYKVDGIDINEYARVNTLPGEHNVETVFRANYENANWTTDLTSPDLGIVSRAKCTAKFSTKAGETLFIFLNPGGNSLLMGRATPRLSIRREGFNMPDLFKGTCEILPDGVTLNW